MTDGQPAPPDPGVLAAFGAGTTTPVPLVGGRGRSWRAGDIVLRPHDGALVTDWRAAVLADLGHTSAFRTPRPVPTRAGAWRCGEWEAWEFVAGAADETRVDDVIRAGRAFHRAVAGVGCPAFLRTADPETDDPWRRADRMAWGEAPLPTDPTLDRLAAAFRPVHAPAQLVHGDLLGNVLFAEGLAPGIIDWPPYWRPAGTGAAIAAVDAVCWHGVSVDRLDDLGEGEHQWRQLLLRALVFRIATLHLLGAFDVASVARHRAVVDALA